MNIPIIFYPYYFTSFSILNEINTNFRLIPDYYFTTITKIMKLWKDIFGVACFLMAASYYFKYIPDINGASFTGFAWVAENNMLNEFALTYTKIAKDNYLEIS